MKDAGKTAQGQKEQPAQVAKLPSYPFDYAGLVLVDGNKAVIRIKSTGHLCGYVALHPEEIPVEWHGNYEADALQYLAVHGGLTYCEVGGGDEDARRVATKAVRDAAVIDESGSLEDRVAALRERREAAKQAHQSVPYEWVVFGFDCAHSGDDEQPELSQAEYVMALTAQMEQQLRDYAAIITDWRAADRATRIKMLEAVIAKSSHRMEMGFGALIGCLGGADAFGPDMEPPPAVSVDAQENATSQMDKPEA